MTMNGENSTWAGGSNTMTVTMNRENPDSEPANQAVHFQDTVGDASEREGGEWVGGEQMSCRCQWASGAVISQLNQPMKIA